MPPMGARSTTCPALVFMQPRWFCRYPYEDKPDRIKAPLLACMKDLEKDHADMLAAYQSGDKEQIEEANQMNNRVRILARDADHHPHESSHARSFVLTRMRPSGHDDMRKRTAVRLE